MNPRVIFQNCHKLERMDLEECVLASIFTQASAVEHGLTDMNSELNPENLHSGPLLCTSQKFEREMQICVLFADNRCNVRTFSNAFTIIVQVGELKCTSRPVFCAKETCHRMSTTEKSIRTRRNDAQVDSGRVHLRCKNGSCEIVPLFETFGRENSCTISQEPFLQWMNSRLPQSGHLREAL